MVDRIPQHISSGPLQHKLALDRGKSQEANALLSFGPLVAS